MVAVAAPATMQKAMAPTPPVVEIPTPKWLSGSIILVWLLTIAFVITAVVAVREHRAALKVVANDSAKSVIAAERIAAALADMDANAANGLLSAQQKEAAVAAYNKGRGQMTDALVDAARNITFDGEEVEIKALAKNSGIYGERVEAAFTLQNGNAPAALSKYLSAAQLLDKTLMPGARTVDKINRDELDTSYRTISRNSKIQFALVWLAGLGMLAVLLRVQFFLSARTRRTLNPLCVLATAIALGLLLYTHHALSTVSHELKVVKADAFESIHAVWQAKAAAFEANAQESRYLLDKQGAVEHQTRFETLAQAIASDPEQLVKLKNNAPTSTGLLADELRNTTFAGERKAALIAVEWWAKYIQVDTRIRALERSGQHEQAVQLCLGEETGQSNWAFNGFISALDEVLKINQTAFDQAAASGFEALDKFEWIAALMGLTAALACLFGVLPRIREYSV